MSGQSRRKGSKALKSNNSKTRTMNDHHMKNLLKEMEKIMSPLWKDYLLRNNSKITIRMLIRNINKPEKLN